MTVESLTLDNDGDLWLCRESPSGVHYRLLGPIGDGITSYAIPEALQADYEEIKADWEESGTFGVACRREALATFERGLGRI